MGLIKRGRLSESGVHYVREHVPQVQTYEGSRTNYADDDRAEELRDTGATGTQDQPQTEELLTQLEAESGGNIEESARSKADEILRNAMEEAESLKSQARDAGLEEARNLAEEGASGKVKDALAMINQATSERKKIIKDAESEVLRLALRVAEQIIRSEVSMHRDVTLNIVADAISRVSDREQVIIRVNREDLEYVKQYKQRIGNIIDGIKTISIVEDSTVDPGGTIVETNLGYVDARISTKISAIDEAFRKVE